MGMMTLTRLFVASLVKSAWERVLSVHQYLERLVCRASKPLGQQDSVEPPASAHRSGKTKTLRRKKLD